MVATFQAIERSDVRILEDMSGLDGAEIGWVFLAGAAIARSLAAGIDVAI